MQDDVRSKQIGWKKVLGADNSADIFTKYVDKGILTKMLSRLGMRVMTGRSAAAPELPPDNPPSKAS